MTRRRVRAALGMAALLAAAAAAAAAWREAAWLSGWLAAAAVTATAAALAVPSGRHRHRWRLRRRGAHTHPPLLAEARAQAGGEPLPGRPAGPLMAARAEQAAASAKSAPR